MTRLLVALFCTFLMGNIAALAQTNASLIKTSFTEDAVLTQEQVQTVLQLAAMAGLKEPGEVSTFHYVPGDSVGIRIRGVEQRNGRRITTEEALEYCSGMQGLPADTNALRLKDFWINPPYIKKGTFLQVKIGGESKTISIDNDLTTETADLLIGAATKELESSPEPKISDLKGITQNKANNTFELWLNSNTGKGLIITCRIEDGKVLVASKSRFVI